MKGKRETSGILSVREEEMEKRGRRDREILCISGHIDQRLVSLGVLVVRFLKYMEKRDTFLCYVEGYA